MFSRSVYIWKTCILSLHDNILTEAFAYDISESQSDTTCYKMAGQSIGYACFKLISSRGIFKSRLSLHMYARIRTFNLAAKMCYVLVWPMHFFHFIVLHFGFMCQLSCQYRVIAATVTAQPSMFGLSIEG